jgi:hypothetical protein
MQPMASITSSSPNPLGGWSAQQPGTPDAGIDWMQRIADTMVQSGEGEGDGGAPPMGGGGGPSAVFPVGQQPDRYTSGHVDAQQTFATELMNSYMSSGGGYYG